MRRGSDHIKDSSELKAVAYKNGKISGKTVGEHPKKIAWEM